MVPQARMTPRCMIAMRSHIVCATSSVCVDMIVWPRRVYRGRDPERARCLRIEAHHRIIDDDHLGLVDERARDDELLPHAVAVALHQLVTPFLEVEECEQLSPATFDFRPRLAVQARDEAKELDARKLLVDERPVRDESQLLLRRNGFGGQVDAGDAHGAGRRSQNSCDERSVVVFPLR